MKGKGQSLAFAASVVACGCSMGREVEHLVFECAGQREIAVQISGDRATLTTAADQYDLDQRPSGIGRKYSSDAATLIIDDGYAAFVTEEGRDFRDCRRRWK